MVYCCVSHTFIDKKSSYLAQSLGNDIAKIIYMYYEKTYLFTTYLKEGEGCMVYSYPYTSTSI